MKKIISLFLVLCVAAAAFSVPAFAWDRFDSAQNSASALTDEDEGDIPDHADAEYYDSFAAKFGKVWNYKELYTHTDESGEPDWVVVNAFYNCCTPVDYTYVIHNRIVHVGSFYYPFSGCYAVYDVKEDSFSALNNDAIEKYDDLAEYVDSMKLGRPFGDVDGDSELSVIDVSVIQRMLANLTTISDNIVYLGGYNGKKYERSDFNIDGETDVIDATYIQRYLAKLCDVYCQPIGSRSAQENTDALVYEFDFSTERPSAESYTKAVEYSADATWKYAYTDIPQIHKEHDFGVTLVRSAAQLKDVTGIVRDAYGDSFFEDNALIVAWGQFNEDHCYAEVDGVYLDGKTLAVDFKYGYVPQYDENGRPIASPTAPMICVLCSVSRDDVKYADSIIAVK